MNAISLFHTVPDRDYLSFGAGNHFDAKAVTEMLNLRKAEVSKIAHVAPSSVRYDDDMPAAVRERLEEIASICNMVAGFFDGDSTKTAMWFKTPNPMLGEVTPKDMVRLGRYDKLRKFVISALVEHRKDQAFAKEHPRGKGTRKA